MGGGGGGVGRERSSGRQLVARTTLAPSRGFGIHRLPRPPSCPCSPGDGACGSVHHHHGAVFLRAGGGRDRRRRRAGRHGDERRRRHTGCVIGVQHRRAGVERVVQLVHPRVQHGGGATVRRRQVLCRCVRMRPTPPRAPSCTLSSVAHAGFRVGRVGDAALTPTFISGVQARQDWAAAVQAGGQAYVRTRLFSGGGKVFAVVSGVRLRCRSRSLNPASSPATPPPRCAQTISTSPTYLTDRFAHNWWVLVLGFCISGAIATGMLLTLLHRAWLAAKDTEAHDRELVAASETVRALGVTRGGQECAARLVTPLAPSAADSAAPQDAFVHRPQRPQPGALHRQRGRVPRGRHPAWPPRPPRLRPHRE
jgi:hypothetical protein